MSVIFSKILKELRGRIGVSQKELAEDLGVSQATVYQWENGYEPSMDRLEQIASYFSISVDKLFGLSSLSSSRIKPSEEKELLTAFEKLNQTNKTRLLGYIDRLMESQLENHPNK